MQLLHKIVNNGFYAKGHGILHLGYFAAVFVEGHGFYATFGGALLVFGLVGFLAGQED